MDLPNLTINECRQVAKLVRFKYPKSATRHQLIVGLYRHITEIPDSGLPPRAIAFFNKAGDYIEIMAQYPTAIFVD